MSSILKPAVVPTIKENELLSSVEQDLLLAAEIGKSLLERNRELEGLLKQTQEYAEEQSAQVEFYVEQVNVLRESSDSYNQSYEQLESTYQQLLDKFEQQKDECKFIEGKNQRLWDKINLLGKRNGEYSNEVQSLEKQVNEQREMLEIYRAKNTAKTNSYEVPEQYSKETDDTIKIINLENEKKTLVASISELKVQLKIESWQKEEVTSQLEEIINENQLLHDRIASLKKEILEWENFAQKEENYRKLAEAFNMKHHIELDYDPMIQASISPNNLTKAKSCEYINQSSRKQNNSCIIKSSNLVKEILSNNTTGSFLSELDSEYADLIQRYEALLEKCKLEGRFNENPERTRKVQRAIQTLSFDFSTLTAPLTSTKVSAGTSITPTAVTPVTEHDALVAAVKTASCACRCKDETPASPDSNYRMIFAEIFEKIRESQSVL